MKKILKYFIILSVLQLNSCTSIQALKGQNDSFIQYVSTGKTQGEFIRRPELTSYDTSLIFAILDDQIDSTAIEKCWKVAQQSSSVIKLLTIEKRKLSFDSTLTERAIDSLADITVRRRVGYCKKYAITKDRLIFWAGIHEMYNFAHVIQNLSPKSEEVKLARQLYLSRWGDKSFIKKELSDLKREIKKYFTNNREPIYYPEIEPIFLRIIYLSRLEGLELFKLISESDATVITDAHATPKPIAQVVSNLISEFYNLKSLYKSIKEVNEKNKVYELISHISSKTIGDKVTMPSYGPYWPLYQ